MLTGSGTVLSLGNGALEVRYSSGWSSVCTARWFLVGLWAHPWAAPRTPGRRRVPAGGRSAGGWRGVPGSRTSPGRRRCGRRVLPSVASPRGAVRPNGSGVRRVPLGTVLLQPGVVAAVAGRPRQAPSMPPPGPRLPPAGDDGERVLAGLHPVQHLAVVELLERRRARAPARSAAPRRWAGAARAGSRATMVVFAALFWLQSTRTLPVAQRLLHVADDQVRGGRLPAPAPVRGRTPTSARRSGCRPAPRTGGCPCCRWSRARGPGPRPAGCARASWRDLGALGEADALAGIQVQHQPVRGRAPPRGSEPPLRHVDLEGADLREPGEGGRVVDQRVLDGTRPCARWRRAAPRPAWSRPGSSGRTPRPGSSAVPTPCTQRFRVAGPVARCRDEDTARPRRSRPGRRPWWCRSPGT